MKPELVLNIPDGAAAGTCYTCRTSCGPPYVRTFIDIDYEGEIVIGKGCLDVIADEAGYLSAQYKQNLKTQIKNLTEKAEKLEPKAAAYDLIAGRIGEVAALTPDEARDFESVS